MPAQPAIPFRDREILKLRFGVADGYTYTTSVSTFDYGQNPSYYQQQIVARVATPRP